MARRKLELQRFQFNKQLESGMRVDGPSGESRLGGSAREELSGADGLMAAGDDVARGLGHRLHNGDRGAVTRPR